MELALGRIGRQTLALGKMELALGRTDQQLADDARRTLRTQGELGASRTTAERRKRKEVLLLKATELNATELNAAETNTTEPNATETNATTQCY